MRTLNTQYRVGVDIVTKLRPLSTKGPSGRLLRELMRDAEAMDRWCEELVRWELGFTGLEQFVEDLHADVILKEAFPLLAPDDREYFETFMEKDLFYEVTNLLMSTDRFQAQRAVVESIRADHDGRGRPSRQRRYRALIEVEAGMTDLNVEWGRGVHERITREYPQDCRMSFDEFVDRQQRLLDAVVGNESILEEWLRYCALFEVAAEGAVHLWPEDVDRSVLVPVIGRMSPGDQQHFAGVAGGPPEYDQTVELENVLSVEFTALYLDPAVSEKSW